MKTLAARFAALADPTRLEMMALLLERGELCVCDFINAIGITQSKASRHLRTLFHAGFLEDRREGLWVHYKIAAKLDDHHEVLLASLSKILSKREPALPGTKVGRKPASHAGKLVARSARASRTACGCRK